jgi:hypothetical protein
MCLACPYSTQNTKAASLSVKSYPGKSVRGRRELKYVQILSQNAQGFNADKEEIILALMQQKNIFAYAIQETWRLGNEISEKYSYYIIQHGSDSKPGQGLWPRSSAIDCSLRQEMIEKDDGYAKAFFVNTSDLVAMTAFVHGEGAP